ncbi:MAG: GcvT family protein, partial [Gammaproteobacteria bacterium]
MNKKLPSQAEVIIIGGGVVGCSVAYHLTKLGISDVLLLERKKLTSGTTWHAAGLVGQLRGSQNMTKLAKYTAELYTELESETGQATGFKQNGSISIATTPGRFEELKRMASMAKVFNLPVSVITAEEVGARYPLLNVDDVVGAIAIPSDGQVNPVDVTQALAKGARTGGARILEDCEVTKFVCEHGKVVGVEVGEMSISCQKVVICGGMWSHGLARSIGVDIPLHACEHFYIVTEPLAEAVSDLPVLRDYDAYSYYKEDAGKILLGAFEPKAKPWGMNGIPETFCFDELPEDLPHFEPVLEMAMHRMPILADTGIQTFFCGPESFTPDVRYQIGQAPTVDNCFIAAGLNSIGIQSAGGIGKVLAAWIRDGYAPMDLWEVDVTRNHSFQANRRYLHDRVTESLGLLYAMHWPYRQYASARGARRSPFYDRLNACNACHGEAHGWERPNWFAKIAARPTYDYSYEKQNWFADSAAEHIATREHVSLFDQTSIAKFKVHGRDALSALNWMSSNDLDVKQGTVVHTQWLNERGTIESDVLIARLDEQEFLILGAAETETRDFAWLQRHLPRQKHVFATNHTSGYAVLAIMGPSSREFLQSMTPDAMNDEYFPYASCREIEIGYARVLAMRVSYVGELGWELYVPTEFALDVYDFIAQQGKQFDLMHAGYHAMNSLRLEKAYRHWGSDISIEDTPIDVGMMSTVKMQKSAAFLGHKALTERLATPPNRVLASFRLLDEKKM